MKVGSNLISDVPILNKAGCYFLFGHVIKLIEKTLILIVQIEVLEDFLGNDLTVVGIFLKRTTEHAYLHRDLIYDLHQVKM